MDQKLVKTTLIVIGICLLLSLVCNIPRCAAQNSWSDYFTDPNYPGWTVEEGTFNASNYILEACGDPGGLVDWHKIRHSSHVAYGNWSLDMYINGSADLMYYVSFIADSLFDWGPNLYVPRNGYAMCFYSQGPPQLALERWTSEDWTEIGVWYPSAFHGWQNITITRDLTGAFSVLVNGTSRITVTDNDHTTSGYFGWMCDPWSAIDNVIVNESKLKDGFPFEIVLIVAAIVVVIVVVIVAVIFRRRKG
ncbi:MAG: hypothetical protein ACFFAL_00945 [Promethearchaeota archaeon]